MLAIVYGKMLPTTVTSVMPIAAQTAAAVCPPASTSPAGARGNRSSTTADDGRQILDDSISLSTLRDAIETRVHANDRREWRCRHGLGPTVQGGAKRGVSRGTRGEFQEPDAGIVSNLIELTEDVRLNAPARQKYRRSARTGTTGRRVGR